MRKCIRAAREVMQDELMQMPELKRLPEDHAYFLTSR